MSGSNGLSLQITFYQLSQGSTDQFAFLHFLSMPYFKNQDPQNPIVEVIKNTIFPDAEPIGVGASFQLLCAGWAGVRCERFDSKAEAGLLFKGKLCQLALRCRREFNLVWLWGYQRPSLAMNSDNGSVPFSSASLRADSSSGISAWSKYLVKLFQRFQVIEGDYCGNSFPLPDNNQPLILRANPFNRVRDMGLFYRGRCVGMVPASKRNFAISLTQNRANAAIRFRPQYHFRPGIRDAGVAGSNPVVPTTLIQCNQGRMDSVRRPDLFTRRIICLSVCRELKRIDNYNLYPLGKSLYLLPFLCSATLPARSGRRLLCLGALCPIRRRLFAQDQIAAKFRPFLS